MESSSSKTPTKAAVSIEALDSLDPETFDWTTFNASYKGMCRQAAGSPENKSSVLTSGRALITRLLFITSLIDPNKPCTARRLGRTAAVLVIPLLKETWDIENYTHAVAYVARCGPEGAAEGECTEAKTGTPDQVWVDETTPTARLENSRLAVELNGYMSNLIKESIRVRTCLQIGADDSSRTLPWPTCRSRRGTYRPHWARSSTSGSTRLGRCTTSTLAWRSST
jgi:COP9 signalosome complex subunit 1